MAKTPTDLTNKSWQKLKQFGVGKTGFGDKLDAYATAKGTLSDLQKRNLATYDTVATVLHGITDAIPAAVKKCNKTLHKDTITALEAYKGLVAKEGSELLKEKQHYIVNRDDWIDRRRVSMKTLGLIHKAMENEEKNAAKLIGEYVKGGKRQDAITVVNDTLKKLTAMQNQANVSCETWRVPKAMSEQPHVDDRPADLFEPLSALVNQVIATRTNAEQKLGTLKKKLEGK
jgi:ATP-dependent exoDNAse (exonuclease V) alpha subunit